MDAKATASRRLPPLANELARASGPERGEDSGLLAPSCLLAPESSRVFHSSVRSRGHSRVPSSPALLTWPSPFCLVRHEWPLASSRCSQALREPRELPHPFSSLLELALDFPCLLKLPIPQNLKPPFSAARASSSPGRHRGSVAPIFPSCAPCTLLSFSPDSDFGCFHRSFGNLKIGVLRP